MEVATPAGVIVTTCALELCHVACAVNWTVWPTPVNGPALVTATLEIVGEGCEGAAAVDECPQAADTASAIPSNAPRHRLLCRMSQSSVRGRAPVVLPRSGHQHSRPAPPARRSAAGCRRPHPSGGRSTCRPDTTACGSGPAPGGPA